MLYSSFCSKPHFIQKLLTFQSYEILDIALKVEKKYSKMWKFEKVRRKLKVKIHLWRQWWAEFFEKVKKWSKPGQDEENDFSF